MISSASPGKESRRAFLRQCSLLAAALPAHRLLCQRSGFGKGEAIVAAPAGSLRGALEDGVRVFRGVPFARPPVGALRFRAPEPSAPWTGVREAVHFASEAMQKAEGEVTGSEDCLYLNLWAPGGNGPHPVFVWIHGGGFTGGSAFAPIFDGAAFAQAGIVVVTVAYRLGVFGFMDLEPLLGAEYAGSANNGTRDLILALQWVKANIAAFGGDPSHVTVGGESAGAKMTAALLGIPEASALFHSAISESGGGERVLTGEHAAGVARAFAALRQQRGDSDDPRTASAAGLIRTQEALIASTSLHFPFRAETGGTLLPQRPVDLVAAGAAKGKRLLLGTNRDESALFLGPRPTQPVTAADLGNLPLAAFEPVQRRYASLYPDMPEPQRVLRAVTAEEYWVPTIRLADAHARNGGDTWMYRLDFSRATGRLAGEAYHSEDLALVWEKLPKDDSNDRQAAALAMQMHAAWIAFLHGTPPAAAGLPSWPAYHPLTRPTMILDRVSRVEERPFERELRLWDNLLT